MICGTFGTGVTFKFIGVPPSGPPGNSCLKNPTGMTKPPVPFVITVFGPPPMQPPGLSGSGPKSGFGVVGAGYMLGLGPKPILPRIEGQGASPFAGRSTNAPAPVAALPVLENVA